MPTCIHRGREGEKAGSMLQRPSGTGLLVSPAKARMWRPCSSACRMPHPTYSEQPCAFKSLGHDAPPSFSALSPALGALLTAWLPVTTASISQSIAGS